MDKILPKFIIALSFMTFIASHSLGQNGFSSDKINSIGSTTLKIFKSLDLYMTQKSQEILNVLNNSGGQLSYSFGNNLKQINPNQIDPFEINPILQDVLTSAPYVFDVALISADGTILAVQPQFPGLIGTNISMQKHFIRLTQTKSPVLSQMFTAVEGFPAVAFQHPIVDNGIFFGALSLLVRPKELLKGIIDSQTKNDQVDIWVMQEDGTIIYDRDVEEIGRNIFSDDIYKAFPSLIAFAKIVSTLESGAHYYDFYDRGTKNVVKKYCQWITVSIYGTKWKIVADSTKDKLSSPYRTLYSLGLKNRTDALRALAKDKNFVDAIKSNDQNTIIDMMQKFYNNYPCYSVQWIDQNSVNRLGVPFEHSLQNFDFSSYSSQKAVDFTNIVRSRKETTYLGQLFEGGIGKFHLVPLFDDKNNYYGMLYDIVF